MISVLHAIQSFCIVALVLSVVALFLMADWDFRTSKKMNEIYQPRHRMPKQPRQRSVIWVIAVASFQAGVIVLERVIDRYEKRWNYRLFFALQYAGNEGL